MSKNVTLSTEFARFHQLTQPWQCHLHKSHISTRLKCCACHAKWHRRCPKCCACHESLQLIFCERFKSIALVTQNDVRHVFADTRQCHEVPRLPRKTPFPHPLKRTQKTSFAAFPNGTGTPPQNHNSVKTRHISYETSSTFQTLYLKNRRFPTNFFMKRKSCHVKFDVSCEASVNFHHLSKNVTLSTEFARFHQLTQPWQCHLHKSHISTRLKCCACHAKWHRRCPNCCACHEKKQRIFRKCSKSIAPATQNDFWHVMKHVGMSRSATLAMRNEATQRWKAPKVTPFAELPIGIAIRPSRERLRTVANGCERLRTVADVNATSGEHSSTPTPPEWNGNPCYAFGNMRRE